MEIEFIEDGHLYLVGGILTPSVTQIISSMSDKYSGIPERILEEKAKFGTHIHEAIEQHERGLKPHLTPMEQVVFEQYLKLKQWRNIRTITMEQFIQYNGRYCGRYDMIAEVDGKRCLCDVKTTAVLDYQCLAWQLGMYQLALGEQFEKCYCIWLPKKDLGRLIEIEPKTKEEIERMLDEYEGHRKDQGFAL